MPKKVISIEISLIKTRICEVDYKKKSPQVYRTISFDTPKGSFEDGFIRDKEALATLIRNKVREAGIRTDAVVFTITSTKMVNREVIIPMVKDDRINDVVKANAGEYFPVNISEYVITYSLLERITLDKEKKIRLLVLAAPEIMVQSYYELAQMMGFHVEAIDYLGNSTYQLVKRNTGSDCSMIVHMNEHTTFLNIVDKGVLSLPRTVTYGIMNIVDIIVDSKNIIISNQDDAHRFLFTQNLIGRERSSSTEELALSSQMMRIDYFNEEKKDALREEITESLQYLINNILRILDYFSRNQEKKINTIYLIGQASSLLGFKEYLFKELGIEIKVIDTLNSVVFSRYVQITSRESAGLIACIGASISPVQFIPRDYLEKNAKSSNIQTIVSALAVGVVISITIILFSIITYRSQVTKNNRLKREISSMSSVEAIYDEYEEALDYHKKAEIIYDMTITSIDDFNKILSEIEKKLPTKVRVDSIVINSGGLALNMKADNEITAAKTLQQLKTISALSQVSTTSIEAFEDENGVTTVEFIIAAVINSQSTLKLEEQTN